MYVEDSLGGRRGYGVDMENEICYTQAVMKG